LALPGGKYDAIIDAFTKKKKGSCGRILVVNPLHAGLPKICMVVQVRQALLMFSSMHHDDFTVVTALYKSISGSSSESDVCTGYGHQCL
jgi:hypothetical protein